MILISALLATILAIAPLFYRADWAMAAAAPGANEKLGALKKAAQAEGMLNLVCGENTSRGLQGVRDLVSGMNKQFGTSIIANWTPGPSQPQMAAKIAQEFAAGVPATSDVYIGGSETYIATLSTPLMVLDRFDWASTFPQIETVGTGTDLVMILLMLPVMILYWRVGNRVGESVSGRKN